MTEDICTKDPYNATAKQFQYIATISKEESKLYSFNLRLFLCIFSNSYDFPTVNIIISWTRPYTYL